MDQSGGYLHHTPEIAAKIITACVRLHNIARRKGFPLPPQEDHEDGDGQRSVMQQPREEPPVQMPMEVPRAAHVARRRQFIERNFAVSRRQRQETPQ